MKGFDKMFITDEDMTKEEFYEKNFKGRVSWDDFISIYSWGYDDGYDDGYDECESPSQIELTKHITINTGKRK